MTVCLTKAWERQKWWPPMHILIWSYSIQWIYRFTNIHYISGPFRAAVIMVLSLTSHWHTLTGPFLTLRFMRLFVAKVEGKKIKIHFFLRVLVPHTEVTEHLRYTDYISCTSHQNRHTEDHTFLDCAKLKWTSVALLPLSSLSFHKTCLNEKQKQVRSESYCQPPNLWCINIQELKFLIIIFCNK